MTAGGFEEGGEWAKGSLTREHSELVLCPPDCRRAVVGRIRAPTKDISVKFNVQGDVHPPPVVI